MRPSASGEHVGLPVGTCVRGVDALAMSLLSVPGHFHSHGLLQYDENDQVGDRETSGWKPATGEHLSFLTREGASVVLA